MRRRVLVAPVAALSAALLGVALASPANAGAVTDEVVTGLVTPLSVAVDGDGTIYVSQNFAGILTKAVPGNDPVTIFHTTDGSEVGAVSVENGVVTFGTTPGGEQSHTGRLWQKAGNAPAAMLLNTTAYETKHNPDAGTNYGFFQISKSCRAKAKFLRKYPGHVDSHPYGSAMDGDTTYLADAGGNDILAITDAGASTVAVLPPTRIKITAEKQKAAGLPRCARGSVFRAEAVPTDVEVGPDGNLYVTSLPGGPEDDSLGANGHVYQVNPTTGDVARLPGPGLVSPTGIAIAPNGTAYISMLFAGVVLKIPYGGSPTPFASIPFPGDVDYANGKVYVTETDLTNDGSSPPAGSVHELNP